VFAWRRDIEFLSSRATIVMSLGSPLQRTVSWCLLALMGILQVPVSAGVPRVRLTKDTSVPFPCQDRACGCQSAEQCYSSCCCFSPADRRRFAGEHGVDADRYGLSDRNGLSDVSKETSDDVCSEEPGCCTRVSISPSACETLGTTPLANIRVPSWSAYLKCRGITPAWSLFTAITFFDRSENSIPAPVPGDYLPLADVRHVPMNYAPETPPPRCD
jgi:hypothetical protein